MRNSEGFTSVHLASFAGKQVKNNYCKIFSINFSLKLINIFFINSTTIQ